MTVRIVVADDMDLALEGIKTILRQYGAFHVTGTYRALADLLDALAAPELSFVVGVLIGSAARRTPCLIDGTGVLAAALVGDRVAHRARGWWRVGSTSTDPARQTAADRLDLPGTKLIVGDGPARAALARKYPQAVFLGARQGEQLAEAYAAADVFVFPSRTDTLGWCCSKR